MNDNKNILYKDLSHKVIGIAMKVHTRLGNGLPEFAYSRSVAIELEAADIPYSREHKYDISYDEKLVGLLVPDLVVDQKIVLEFKRDEAIYPHHLSQLLTYLHVTGLRVGYVLNYGQKSLQFRRLIL